MTLRDLKEYLLYDLEAMGGKTHLASGWRNIYFYYWKSLSFRVVVHYRLGNLFRVRGMRYLGAFFDRKNWLLGADICSAAKIGKGMRIAHPKGIVIGGGVAVGNFSQIQQNVTIGGSFGKTRNGDPDWTSPRIGDSVFIGPGAVVIGPIRIGDRAVIGANAVATKDVPEDTIVVKYNEQRCNAHRADQP
jgi:serine O-acetyltransferase